MMRFGTLLLGSLLMLLTGCDQPSVFIGHWEYDLEASQAANPDHNDWSAQENGAYRDIYEDGSYVAVTRASRHWKETSWEGNWEVLPYQAPFSAPDSLEVFLSSLPVKVGKYMNSDRMPEYELVFQPKTNHGQATSFPEPERRIVLEITNDRLITYWNSLIQVYNRTD